MRKYGGFLFILACIVLGSPSPGMAALKQETLTIQTSAKETRSFTVEIAQTQKEQEVGLQHRTQMAADHGMLFIFPEDTYIEMWMKDTELSLDMLFIDNHGKIVYIAKKATPGSTDIISARRDARAVLELLGGAADKFGIKVGDQVVYSYFKP